jgi:hypothetical protein
MRGTLVIARLYDGSAALMRVWESGRETIYLSEEKQFQKLSRGENGLWPVGFPKYDVFAYDPAVGNAMDSLIDWDTLRPITDTVNLEQSGQA